MISEPLEQAIELIRSTVKKAPGAFKTDALATAHGHVECSKGYDKVVLAAIVEVAA